MTARRSSSVLFACKAARRSFAADHVSGVTGAALEAAVRAALDAYDDAEAHADRVDDARYDSLEGIGR